MRHDQTVGLEKDEKNEPVTLVRVTSKQTLSAISIAGISVLRWAMDSEQNTTKDEDSS